MSLHWHIITTQSLWSTLGLTLGGGHSVDLDKFIMTCSRHYSIMQSSSAALKLRTPPTIYPLWLTFLKRQPKDNDMSHLKFQRKQRAVRPEYSIKRKWFFQNEGEIKTLKIREIWQNCTSWPVRQELLQEVIRLKRADARWNHRSTRRKERHWKC